AAPELDLALRIGGRLVEATGTWFERDVPCDDGVWHTGLSSLHPMWRATGAWPAESAQAIALGAALAHSLAARPGDTLRLDAGGVAAAVRVTAVVEAGGFDDRRAWLPLALAQRLARRPGELDRVALSALLKPDVR